MSIKMRVPIKYNVDGNKKQSECILNYVHFSYFAYTFFFFPFREGSILSCFAFHVA